ncbi:MAG: hypothetical protein UF217_02240 [Acutalibacteraceae bacterium]|nr:hypothetical protein [Acutalibacteraceae bacterium]
MNNRISGKNLPAEYVRENFYLCYDGDDMIGVFNLKFELTEFLLNFGGHIGYAVKPSRRNRVSTSPANSDLGACCASATRTT